MPPHFLVVGHLVQDIVAGGWRLGGTAAFASLFAARLGLRAAVLTSTSPELDLAALLPGVEVASSTAEGTTQFENIYSGARRIQYVRRRGPLLTPDMLPKDWRRAAIVLLGPVVGEVDSGLATCFPQALLGVSAQGWLRRVGPDQRVRPLPPQAWDAAPLLGRAAALFVSDEDLSPPEAPRALAAWSALVPILAYTRGPAGADICYRGEWRHIGVFPAKAVDATGAGDIFAAAFLIRLYEGCDAWEAARFASCAASFVIEGEGISRLPSRQEIEARLAAHLDIVCRPA